MLRSGVTGASRGWIVAGLLAAALALAGALWLWRAAAGDAPGESGRGDPAAPARPAPAASSMSPAGGRPRPPGAEPRWQGPGTEPAAPAITPVRAPPLTSAEPQHLMDPCTELSAVPPPAGFDSLAAQGVTVAWSPGAPALGPSDAALRPLSLAHLVAGLLEEAAQLTGTERRAELTVVIYSTVDAFRTGAKAPTWAAGLYDGAVRVPPEPRAELGVALSTLRHEVMHAQLHAAVGCMPVWLNEGAAMYFAGPPPARAWLELLRARPPLELALLEAPGLDEHAAPRVDRVYAQSLAMVLFDLDRAGGALVPTLVSLADANRASPQAGLALWSRLHPGTDHGPVLDALARRIFGPAAADLGESLDGPLCCHGLARATELACRATAARPNRTLWTDETSSPRASCRARW
jgi:hypothetical protein